MESEASPRSPRLAHCTDSPDVDEGAHYKDVLQNPDPRALNMNDFGDSHRLAHLGELAPCRHDESGREEAPLGRAWLSGGVWAA